MSRPPEASRCEVPISTLQHTPPPLYRPSFFHDEAARLRRPTVTTQSSSSLGRPSRSSMHSAHVPTHPRPPRAEELPRPSMRVTERRSCVSTYSPPRRQYREQSVPATLHGAQQGQQPHRIASSLELRTSSFQRRSAAAMSCSASCQQGDQQHHEPLHSGVALSDTTLASSSSVQQPSVTLYDLSGGSRDGYGHGGVMRVTVQGHHGRAPLRSIFSLLALPSPTAFTPARTPSQSAFRRFVPRGFPETNDDDDVTPPSSMHSGVPSPLVEMLPIETFSPLRCASTPDSTCLVCQLEYGPGDVFRRLPCLHCFHTACIDRWLSIHGRCPVCRISVVKGLEHCGLDSEYRRTLETRAQGSDPDCGRSTATSGSSRQGGTPLSSREHPHLSSVPWSTRQENNDPETTRQQRFRVAPLSGPTYSVTQPQVHSGLSRRPQDTRSPPSPPRSRRRETINVIRFPHLGLGDPSVVRQQGDIVYGSTSLGRTALPSDAPAGLHSVFSATVSSNSLRPPPQHTQPHRRMSQQYTSTLEHRHLFCEQPALSSVTSQAEMHAAVPTRVLNAHGSAQSPPVAPLMSHSTCEKSPILRAAWHLAHDLRDSRPLPPHSTEASASSQPARRPTSLESLRRPRIVTYEQGEALARSLTLLLHQRSAGRVRTAGGPPPCYAQPEPC